MRPEAWLPAVVLCCCAATLHAVHQDSSPHTRTAVAGQPAVLPCPTAPLPPHRTAHHLILVFKDGLSAPVYSWDSRTKTQPSPTGCSRCPGKELEGRSYFWSPESDSAPPAEGDSEMPELMPDWRNHVFQANFVPESSMPESESRNDTEIPVPKRLHSASGPAWVPQEPGLVLDPVRLGDAGDYLCRVDFPNSPTRNTFVQLRVVEPMQNISVMGFITSTQGQISSTQSTSADLNTEIPNEETTLQSVDSGVGPEKGSWFDTDDRKAYGRKILPDRPAAPTSLPPPKVLGPYPVGSEVLLQCEVIHGSPPPTLRWEDDEGSLVAASAMTAGVRRSSISYRLANVSLAAIGAFITCVAQNSPLTPVLRAAAIIDVGVPPSSVTILAPQPVKNPPPTDAPETTARDRTHTDHITPPHTTGNWTVLAESGVGPSPAHYEVDEGVELSLLCDSAASRPAAALLWTRADDLPLPHHFVKVSHLPASPAPLTTTRSALHMRATAALHGAVLRCSAQQAALHAAVQLSVNYAPLVELSSNATASAVGENSSVAFRCRVTAHPPPRGAILLYKNNDVVHRWPTSGNGDESVTVALTVGGSEWSGQYTCAAGNSLATGTSPPLHLRVNYAPRCAAPHTSYSTRGGESILVTCAVSSQPRPAGFRWYVVPQDGSVPVELDPSAHQDRGRSSTLEYVPPLHPPYPRLHCMAHNRVGSMAHPCVIRIVPAAEPDSVQTCRADPVSGKEDFEISVVCEPGRDGGLNQSFTLEIRPSRNPSARPPKALYLSQTPAFNVIGLLPNEEYTFTVTASNARGLSAPYVLTYVVPLEQPQAYPSVILREDIGPMILIAFGAMAAVIMCSLGALLARWVFVRSKNGKVKSDHSGFSPSTADYRRLRHYNNGSLVRDGGKSSMLTSCVGPSARRGQCCLSADASSCGDDSSSRSSCRSAADTLLWTLSSDAGSARTFRHSGCYHIANLTPPECSAVSHHGGDHRHHQVLVTEIHAPDTPRSSSSQYSFPSCHGEKFVADSSPCECSSPTSHACSSPATYAGSSPATCGCSSPTTYACSSPATHASTSPVTYPCSSPAISACSSPASPFLNGRAVPKSCDHACASKSSLSRKSRLPLPEFSESDHCLHGPQVRRQTDSDVTGPCPEVEALLSFENGSQNQADDRNYDRHAYPCSPKQNFKEHKAPHKTVAKEGLCNDDFTQHEGDSSNSRGLEVQKSNIRGGSSDLEDSEETSMELLQVPCSSDTSSEHSSRPSSSVSMATVALNPSYEIDQQLSESDS